MDPVVPPYLIYLLSVGTKLQYITYIMAIGFGICTLVLILGFLFSSHKKETGDLIKRFMSYTVTSAVISILIPDEQTLCAILTTYFITPENASSVQGNITDFVNQIIEAAKK